MPALTSRGRISRVHPPARRASARLDQVVHTGRGGDSTRRLHRAPCDRNTTPRTRGDDRRPIRCQAHHASSKGRAGGQRPSAPPPARPAQTRSGPARDAQARAARRGPQRSGGSPTMSPPRTTLKLIALAASGRCDLAARGSTFRNRRRGPATARLSAPRTALSIDLLAVVGLVDFGVIVLVERAPRARKLLHVYAETHVRRHHDRDRLRCRSICAVAAPS